MVCPSLDCSHAPCGASLSVLGSELSRCQARMGLGWGGGSHEQENGRGTRFHSGRLSAGHRQLVFLGFTVVALFCPRCCVREKVHRGPEGVGGGVCAESEDPWGQPAWEVISLLLSTLGTVPAPHPLLVLYWAQISLPSKRGITLLAYRRSINK